MVLLVLSGSIVFMFVEVREHMVHLLQAVTGASRLTYASIGVGLLIAFLYFKLFFKNSTGFAEDTENAAKMFWLRRWVFWYRSSQYVDWQWSEMKVLVWIGLSVGSGILAYYQLPGWFPQVFR